MAILLFISICAAPMAGYPVAFYPGWRIAVVCRYRHPTGT
jgi:hypothetical protein